MSGFSETFVETALGRVRVWSKGDGPALGVFPGYGGLPKWTPFLEALSAERCVIAPSLPGFPGGAPSESLDDRLDSILAARDVFAAAGLEGADLVGCSFGGAMAAEIAAVWPDTVRKLVLVAPYGLFEADDPVADLFAQRPGETSAALSRNPKALDAWLAPPEDADRGEWEVMALRANVAAANIVWPLGETGVRKRLARVTAPTLVVWGEADRIIPPTYATLFAKSVREASVVMLPDAGHMAEFDQPDAVARAVLDFLA